MKQEQYDSQPRGVYSTGGRWSVTMPDSFTLNFRAKKKGEHKIPYDRIRPAIEETTLHRQIRLSPEGQLEYDRYGRLIISTPEVQRISLLYDGHNLVLDAQGKGNVTISVSSLYGLVEAYEKAQDARKRELRKSRKLKEFIRHGMIPREISDLISPQSDDLTVDDSDDGESIEEKLELLRKS